MIGFLTADTSYQLEVRATNDEIEAERLDQRKRADRCTTTTEVSLRKL